MKRWVERIASGEAVIKRGGMAFQGGKQAKAAADKDIS
jgi:hypothetical protein